MTSIQIQTHALVGTKPYYVEWNTGIHSPHPLGDTERIGTENCNVDIMGISPNALSVIPVLSMIQEHGTCSNVT